VRIQINSGRHLKEQYPYGFDVIVDASGNHQVLEMAIDFCARGGKLVYYGVYSKEALIKVSPARDFSNEITMIGFVYALLLVSTMLTSKSQIIFGNVVCRQECQVP